MRERLQLREGWTSFILLLLLLLTMARSFEMGGLADGLSILSGVAMLGAIVGLGCAKLRVPGIVAHLVGLVLGLLFCYLMVCALVELPAEFKPDGWLSAELARGEIVVTRVQMWMGVAVHGESSSDSLPFVVQMAGLTWLMAFYGAWSLFHSHWVWGAILPAGLTIFLGVYYAPPRLLVYFVLYLLWALILIVRFNYYQRECEWQRHRAVFEPYGGLNFLRDGALLATIVVGLVWLLPHPSPTLRWGDAQQLLAEPLRVVQDEWSRLYASLAYRDQVSTGAFGRSLTLGGAVNMGVEPVLEVKAPESHYWRAVVLDDYTGRGWIDTSPLRLRIDGGAPLVEQDLYAARAVMTQTVTSMRAGETLLFAAAEPWRVPLRTDVQALLKPSGGNEISCITPAQSLGRDRRYTVESLVSTASIRQLQAAGSAYPAWILERYLQTPDALPSRIADLARVVAGGEPTPYDQAVAIEAYLRHMRYNQAIEEPPADRDPVDWFLFEYRQGYCTYYASAMVLMCRTLGLPARLAQGYAPGDYVAERDAYVVREADAHAWPEVYFPGYGWIEFEPTPARPAIIRRTGDEAPGAEQSSGDNAAHSRERRRRNEPELDDAELPDGAPTTRHVPLVEQLPWREIFFAGVLAAAVLAVVLHYGRRWWSLRPVERLYMRLAWLAGPLGVRMDPCQTPYEYAGALDTAAGGEQLRARRIVELYVRERFAGIRAEAPDMAAGRRAWRLLSLAALRRWVTRPFARRHDEPEEEQGEPFK